MLKIYRTRKTLEEAAENLRASGKKIALVPTMGALHEGHISLVKLAFQYADAVIVSIFVNPTQFGPNEDFSRYPRTEAEDLQKLEAAGTTIAYIPAIEEMYGSEVSSTFELGGIVNELDGAFRPGHFNGVATIVTKLFEQTDPDFAIFGEKDYQQLHIIRQLVSDLKLKVKIIPASIMREADGLAMSSRNRYLDARERKVATMLYAALTEAAKSIRAGKDSAQVIEEARQKLLTGGFNKIDYIEMRDAVTLKPVHTLKSSVRLLAAAHLGATRLIDNIPI
jgi:pantoate--beta-alanine ligase